MFLKGKCNCSVAFVLVNSLHWPASLLMVSSHVITMLQLYIYYLLTCCLNDCDQELIHGHVLAININRHLGGGGGGGGLKMCYCTLHVACSN